MALERPQFFVVYVEVASIVHALKLYQKYTLKCCRLFTHQNYIKTACQNDVKIRRYCRVDEILILTQHVESVGITEQNWL